MTETRADTSRLGLSENSAVRRLYRSGIRYLRGQGQLLYLRCAPRSPGPALRISFCTSVKDRFEHLQRTFLENVESNLDYPHCEFVLLDYNCPDPRTRRWAERELAGYVSRGRVVYGFFPGADNFARSHARNLSFRLSSGDVFCNIDADSFTGPGFAAYLDRLLADGRSFAVGPRDGRGLHGRIAVRRDHFEEIGGYDERFVDWGSEDGDLTDRLRASGVVARSIRPERFLHSIQHPDEMRVRHHATKSLEQSALENARLAEENRRLGRLCPNGPHFGCGRVERNFGEWIQFD